MEEKRIMKKSTLLSLATAGAIVATSVGTFAAWDTTTAKSTGMVNFGSPVTVTTSDMTTDLAIDGTRAVGTDPVYKSEPVKFVISDVTDVKAMSIEAKVLDGSTEITDGVTTKIYKADGLTEVTGDVVKADLVAGDIGNSYIVEITPTDGTKVELANKNLTVEVTATLK